MTDNGDKSEGNTNWLTHDEIDFLNRLGQHIRDRPRDRKTLLQNYLAAMPDRDRWIDFVGTRLDRNEIEDAVKSIIAKM